MRFTRKLVSGFVAACMSVGVSAATVWEPTDGDINTFDLGFGITGISYGIFDDDNMGLEPELGYLPLQTFDRVRFQQAGSDWNLVNVSGDLFTLTGSDRFLIAANDGSGWTADAGFIPIGVGSNSQVLYFDGPSLLLAVDVKPVPLPGALVLMATGLAGMATIARRKAVQAG